MGGATTSRPASAPHAPSTALRAVPLPRFAVADNASSSRGAVATKQSRFPRKPSGLLRYARNDACASVLATRPRARALPTTKQIDSPPGKKREAKRRKAQCQPLPRTPTDVAICRCLKRGCAPLSRARPPSGATPRHSPPAITPMAQPQNRVSSRHGAEVFCLRAAVRLELSTLRADRSFCRPTGAPGPPGSGSHSSARGHRTRSASESALAKASLDERDVLVCNQYGDDC